ncbi:LPS export ABC transporter permease LptG [Marinospirillum alkaliphilum]|uniref:Lipopolysaccharide export system permease protein n=1 Tax=Marinospirillum alkaliphilum DSM 21637 TaxID=1122209 RepID=A0A1K1V8G0_9GAMM|nr:LPS export ABC transporter permease LptG [Marinospirillum alkaliphilum]SFX21430.1 lipopolysaccharide export system permease protein [Marinospirillum alkaliphilum DSM 21637]
MRLLGRYIASSVLWATISVLLVIVALDLVFSFLDELTSLTGDYGALDALIYMLLRLPERFYMFLPIAILVGVLIGLGSLASTSELTVMRAAGVSIPRLILQASRPVAVLLVLAMLVSEFFMQGWAQTAETWRWEKRSGQQQSGVNTARDLWLKEGQWFYRINLARDDGQLRGLTLFELSDDWSLKQLVTATRADYQDDQWLLQEVRSIHLESERLLQAQETEVLRHLPVSPEFVALQVLSPSDIPPSRLWRYARYLEQIGQPAGFYWLAFWQKVLLPITVFAVVLLGASFTFGPLRSVPAGTRVFHGIIIGLSVKFAQDLLGPSALLWGFTPALAVLLPAAFCTVWGLWQIRRTG